MLSQLQKKWSSLSRSLSVAAINGCFWLWFCCCYCRHCYWRLGNNWEQPKKQTKIILLIFCSEKKLKKTLRFILDKRRWRRQRRVISPHCLEWREEYWDKQAGGSCSWEREGLKESAENNNNKVWPCCCSMQNGWTPGLAAGSLSFSLRNFR